MHAIATILWFILRNVYARGLFIIVLCFLPAQLFASTHSTSPRYVHDEVIVEVQRGYRPNTSYQLEEFAASDIESGTEFLLLTIDDGERVGDVIEDVERLPHVVSAEPNYTVQMEPNEPNDTNFSAQWHHDATAGIKSVNAWNTQTGSENVLIGVIDTGVDLDHQDLAANIWVNTSETPNNGADDDRNGYIDDVNGWDFISNDNVPLPTPDGFNENLRNGADEAVTHGTHVAGLISAVGNNSEGVSGVSWSSAIMPVKAFDDEGQATNMGIASAITYAVDNGADILNLSFGGTSNNSLIQSAVQYAVDNGVLVVAAAGNDEANMNLTPVYPVCYSGVLGVTATTSSKTASDFSNYGSACADVAAPGTSIYSTLYTDDTPYGFTQDYGLISGTSMSAPIVSGIAALLRSQDSTLSATAIKNIITSSADDVGLSTEYGAGLADAERALQSIECLNSDDTVDPLTAYYIDNDGDGLGDEDSLVYLCRSLAPAEYVNEGGDTNDDDGDNDGVITASDCNDSDDAVSEEQQYYKDNDGDSLGSRTEGIAACQSTAPTGYVRNAFDRNDQDRDNDGVNSSSDCNDRDRTIATKQMYYQDEDLDGLGNPRRGQALCRLIQPSGYVTNNVDTNDSIANGGVEITGDNKDNDGDGITDEVNTVAENGVHPTFSHYPFGTTEYALTIRSIQPQRNGTVEVEYIDRSVYAYTIFSGAKKIPTVARYGNTNAILVLNPNGKLLALMNPLNGKILDQQRLGQESFESNAVLVKKINSTIHIITLSKKKSRLNISVLGMNVKNTAIKKYTTERLQQKEYQRIDLEKTIFRLGSIEVRNKKGERIDQLFFYPVRKGAIRLQSV